MSYITHNDADGLVSAILFKEYLPGSTFKGFYDLRSFYLTEELDKEDDIGIDMDLNTMKCIGHHMNPLNRDNTLANNPNTIYDNLYNNYYSKCPFNCAMLLLKGMHLKLETLRQLAIIVFCDGFFTYCEKYIKNCRNWTKEYELEYILDDFLTNKEEVLKIINEEIVPIFSDKGIYNALKVKIRNGRIRNIEEINRFAEYVIKEFGFNVDPKMFDKEYPIQENYIVKTINYNTPEEYEDKILQMEQVQGKETTIISSAMVYRNQINLTLTKDYDFK